MLTYNQAKLKEKKDEKVFVQFWIYNELPRATNRNDLWFFSPLPAGKKFPGFEAIGIRAA